jgi:hypothetical protein
MPDYRKADAAYVTADAYKDASRYLDMAGIGLRAGHHPDEIDQLLRFAQASALVAIMIQLEYLVEEKL